MDYVLIVLGAAIATLATTISKTLAFKEFRLVLRPLPILGSLVRCPYCLGHWFSLVACFWYWDFSWSEIVSHPKVSLTIWLFLTFVSGLCSGLLCWSLNQMENLKSKEEKDAEDEALHDSARCSLY